MVLDPELDLVLRRDLPLPPDAVWRAWTEPDLLMQWFTPSPWRTTDAELELRPGGIFRTVMAGPAGEEGGGTGCILEVVPERRLVWTGALLPGFRPAVSESGVPVFTALIEMEPLGGGGTRYTATVRHADAAGRDVHEGMGFEAGWGAALDQLVAVMGG
ncbi:MAG: SRPBCC family protein [Candidatus Nanopelagicales bacterium]